MIIIYKFLIHFLIKTRIVETENLNTDIIEKRLVESDRDLQLLFKNGEELATNIRVEHENRQQIQNIKEKCCDNGIVLVLYIKELYLYKYI